MMHSPESYLPYLGKKSPELLANGKENIEEDATNNSSSFPEQKLTAENKWQNLSYKSAELIKNRSLNLSHAQRAALSSDMQATIDEWRTFLNENRSHLSINLWRTSQSWINNLEKTQSAMGIEDNFFMDEPDITESRKAYQQATAQVVDFNEQLGKNPKQIKRLANIPSWELAKMNIDAHGNPIFRDSSASHPAPTENSSNIIPIRPEEGFYTLDPKAREKIYGKSLPRKYAEAWAASIAAIGIALAPSHQVAAKDEVGQVSNPATPKISSTHIADRNDNHTPYAPNNLKHLYRQSLKTVHQMSLEKKFTTVIAVVNEGGSVSQTAADLLVIALEKTYSPEAVEKFLKKNRGFSILKTAINNHIPGTWKDLVDPGIFSFPIGKVMDALTEKDHAFMEKLSGDYTFPSVPAEIATATPPITEIPSAQPSQPIIAVSAEDNTEKAAHMDKDVAKFLSREISLRNKLRNVGDKNVEDKYVNVNLNARWGTAKRILSGKDINSVLFTGETPSPVELGKEIISKNNIPYAGLHFKVLNWQGQQKNDYNTDENHIIEQVLHKLEMDGALNSHSVHVIHATEGGNFARLFKRFVDQGLIKVIPVKHKRSDTDWQYDANIEISAKNMAKITTFLEQKVQANLTKYRKIIYKNSNFLNSELTTHVKGISNDSAAVNPDEIVNDQKTTPAPQNSIDKPTPVAEKNEKQPEKNSKKSLWRNIKSLLFNPTK